MSCSTTPYTLQYIPLTLPTAVQQLSSARQRGSAWASLARLVRVSLSPPPSLPRPPHSTCASHGLTSCRCHYRTPRFNPRRAEGPQVESTPPRVQGPYLPPRSLPRPVCIRDKVVLTLLIYPTPTHTAGRPAFGLPLPTFPFSARLYPASSRRPSHRASLADHLTCCNFQEGAYWVLVSCPLASR